MPLPSFNLTFDEKVQISMASTCWVFDEYHFMDSTHGKVHPYYVTSGSQPRGWYMQNVDLQLSLKEIGNLCNLSDDEMTMLALKYGV